VSVISVKETASSGSERQNERTLEIRHEFNREFVVQTNSSSDDEMVIKKANGIPRVGDGLGNGTAALCMEVNPVRDSENINTWRVTAAYRYRESDPNDKPTTEFIAGKVEQPPSVRSGLIYEERPIHNDIYGNPIVNSVGEMFGERPSVRHAIPWVEVTRFENDNNGNITSAQWANTINSDFFWGCVAGQVKLEDIHATRFAMQTGGGWFYYWKVTYVLHFCKEGWNKRIIDAGMNELADLLTYYPGSERLVVGRVKDGTKTEILDSKKRAVMNPVRLDGKGHPLSDKALPSHILEFECMNGLYFNWLNLPNLRMTL